LTGFDYGQGTAGWVEKGQIKAAVGVEAGHTVASVPLKRLNSPTDYGAFSVRLNRISKMVPFKTDPS
jgi:hypothetical protein